uniref:Testis expressed 9 n=1 Tax=Oryzias sinensis TaxID=183150 RepID=A0A8C7ZQC7_9TELE
MAERSSNKTVRSVFSKTKDRPSSTSKAEKAKKVQFRSQAKSACDLSKKKPHDLLSKEEEYRLINAELEAKTADLVRQTEQLMREQREVLSRPLSNVLLSDTEDIDDSSITQFEPCLVEDPSRKVVPKNKFTSAAQNPKQGKKPQNKSLSAKASHNSGDDTADFFLAKTIQKLEEEINDTASSENAGEDVCSAEDFVGSGVSDAHIRILKAKLRILQEELDQLSHEYYKKDDENANLCVKIKELEEDHTRLQRTTNIQQTQIEKHKALAEDSSKKCDALQLQVSALNKEIEDLKRSQKQAAGVHSTAEVRLNRALEEVEWLKTQLNKSKQMNKDKISEEHESRERLIAENNTLQKQKAELIVGFKKQLKLIDILKRQKMHFEAAKLLSFTEEEFMKALDWGKL